MVASSSNLLNDTQYHILPLHNHGLKQTMPSEDPLHCVFPLNPSRGGEESECINPTGEEKTPFVQSPPEGEETPCVQSPPGGKILCVQSSAEEEKTLCVQSHDTSNLVQFQNVYIQEKVRNLPVGGRLRHFLPEWEKQGSHRLIIGLIKD